VRDWARRQASLRCTAQSKSSRPQWSLPCGEVVVAEVGVISLPDHPGGRGLCALDRRGPGGRRGALDRRRPWRRRAPGRRWAPRRRRAPGRGRAAGRRGRGGRAGLVAKLVVVWEHADLVHATQALQVQECACQLNGRAMSGARCTGCPAAMHRGAAGAGAARKGMHMAWLPCRWAGRHPPPRHPPSLSLRSQSLPSRWCPRSSAQVCSGAWVLRKSRCRLCKAAASGRMTACEHSQVMRSFLLCPAARVRRAHLDDPVVGAGSLVPYLQAARGQAGRAVGGGMRGCRHHGHAPHCAHTLGAPILCQPCPAPFTAPGSTAGFPRQLIHPQRQPTSSMAWLVMDRKQSSS
jgi:hypothetical protein